MAQSRRPHHDKLALGGQPIEGKEHGDEDADRQHDVEEAGQNQQRKVEKYLD